MRKIFSALLLMLFSSMALAANYTAGFEYRSIEQQPVQNPAHVEVIEFFWYGCPHCYQFEPDLNRWLSDKPANVDFIRVPAPLNKNWELHTRAYYALQMMGVLDKVHHKIFDEMHLKRNRALFKEEGLANFLATQGVDREELLKKMHSFAVSGKLNKAKKMVQEYKINGVPTIAINGKYITSGRMAGSHENMIKVMNYLIKKESAK